MFSSKNALCLFFAFFVALAGCSPQLTPEELLARAETAIDEGDLASAEIDLKSVLRDAPENPRARALYGAINIQRLEADAAVEQFERSLAALESAETRLSFAKALVQAGESAELVSEWQIGSFVTIESEAQFQAALAQAFLAQAQPDEAKAALQRALAAGEADDNYIAFTQALVSLQVDRDQETAQESLQSIVERDPKHARAWSLLGLLAWQNRDFVAAEEYYEKAAAANPYRVGDRIQLVETQVRLGKADVASANLSKLETQLRNYPAIRFLRAQLLFDEGNYEGAIDLFNQILSVSPDNPGALLLAGNANARINKLPIARRHLERFLELQPGSTQAALQLAQVNALMGEPGRTEELARSLLEREADNQTALTLLANALAAQGMHAESAQVFKQLADLRPESTENLVALGSQQIVAGDLDAGLKQLEDALAGDPDNSLARERLIEARLVAQDLDGALEEASRYVEVEPDSTRALIFRGRVLLQRQNTDAAREDFEEALRRDPASVPARGGLAAIAVLGQDLEGAQSEFEKSLEANPGNLQSSLNLAVVLERRGELVEMEQVLSAAVEANPTAVAPRVALARKAMMDKQPAIAIELLSVEEIARQKDVGALQTLTGAYVLAEQAELAQLSAKELLELRPNDPMVLALSARADVLSQDFASAREQLESALEMAPNVSALRKQLIEVLVYERELDLAIDQIEQLSPESQNEAAVLQLRGRIALAQDDAKGAVDWLARAYEKSPDSESLFFLATARLASGERTELVGELSSWIEAHPEDARNRSVLAALLIETGDEAGATAQYQTLIDDGSEDVVALNNLAWLIREQQTSKALEYIQRADRLAPDSFSVKDTYAMVELERGEFDRALMLNQRAIDGAPDPKEDLLLNRARILAAAGRGDEARGVLEKLLSQPDVEQELEARALLESL
ncbi:XrtA/PEP-CTERM system TPR-repeat protein PrsT [Congregibacter litoralis]|uniref:Putative PEP-CTERM system TPR-repeat protein lipoprotein n=1 Tax=Congregibacter litoralis KT71 TaxID=314285 RepID=A4A528_9GAMM|nr:XrtA/PEP-CTERM system TPR-repeat protein PrsT [Congregibacter litoralis]EAQ98899.1 putative PEP-CTERM system TPR-repeat protein lipoprotein [Congregibacter litoralis KT71]